MHLTLHVIPEQDSNLTHKPQTMCMCNPTLERSRAMTIVTHNMIGEGPNKWKLITDTGINGCIEINNLINLGSSKH